MAKKRKRVKEKKEKTKKFSLEKDLVKPQENTIFDDIGIFIDELISSYHQRYNYWEDSTNLILSVLRKMQTINHENSNLLIETIENSHDKIKKGLDLFKIKRDYMEKIAGTNFNEVAEMLKGTLNLLTLQLKEFKIKNKLNQLLLN